jgi:hypothetical protein
MPGYSDSVAVLVASRLAGHDDWYAVYTHVDAAGAVAERLVEERE